MIPWLLKFKFVFLWLAVSGGIGGYYYYLFYHAPDKTALLPGITTHGHHQIEMECAACHTNEKQKNIFTSSGVPSSACIDCHGEALEEFSDSHPVRKFKNPENAVFIKHINAVNCVTCHQEHNQKITGEMSVSLPADYCAHCHDSTLRNLESHKNLDYQSCATAGCHNYHDNTALAPSYLLNNYGKPDLLEDPRVPELQTLQSWLDAGHKQRPPATLANAPSEHQDQAISHQWQHTAHAAAGVNCTDCHGPSDSWVDKPGIDSCNSCHDHQVHDFKQGKHGMRLAFDSLSPMSPSMARIPMKAEAAHRSLDCNACHQPHKEDRKFAAYEACIQCHDDEHTRNYENSTHHKLWLAEVESGVETRTGVSCASCHMPRVKRDGNFITSHDQTANLRPNEKMIKSVCANCHGLQFSMNALADPHTVTGNFHAPSSLQHPGMTWAVEDAISRGDKKIIAIRDYLESLRPKEESPDKQK